MFTDVIIIIFIPQLSPQKDTRDDSCSNLEEFGVQDCLGKATRERLRRYVWIQQTKERYSRNCNKQHKTNKFLYRKILSFLEKEHFQRESEVIL